MPHSNSDVLVYAYASLLMRENPTVKHASKRAEHWARTAINVWPEELKEYSIQELADEMLTVAVLGIRDAKTALEARYNQASPSFDWVGIDDNASLGIAYLHN